MSDVRHDRAALIEQARKWPRDCEGVWFNEMADEIEALAAELAAHKRTYAIFAQTHTENFMRVCDERDALRAALEFAKTCIGHPDNLARIEELARGTERTADQPAESPPIYTAQANTPYCPKCGQLAISIPRMGISHVCPTAAQSVKCAHCEGRGWFPTEPGEDSQKCYSCNGLGYLTGNRLPDTVPSQSR